MGAGREQTGGVGKVGGRKEEAERPVWKLLLESRYEKSAVT